VCADSRKVQKGDIFVAVTGTHVDGHVYPAGP
jgi:UDP-N-acetylmuramyl tripeptide synthase